MSKVGVDAAAASRISDACSEFNLPAEPAVSKRACLHLTNFSLHASCIPNIMMPACAEGGEPAIRAGVAGALWGCARERAVV